MSLQENPNDGESIAEATLSDRLALVHGRLPPTNDFSVGIGHLNHAAAGRDVKDDRQRGEAAVHHAVGDEPEYTCGPNPDVSVLPPHAG
jgi:hypothetical protein